MSLRSRLVAALTVIALLLVGAGIVITRNIGSHLLDRIDTQLAQTVRLAPSVLGERPRNRPSSELSSLYVALILQDRTVETRSTPDLLVAGAAPPDLEDARLTAVAGTGQPVTIESTDGTFRYRAISVGRGRAQVVFAAPLIEVDATVRRLVAVLRFTTLAISAMLALIGYWVMRYGVRPINQMTATARAIADGDMSHRVPEVQGGSEAGTLGAALNLMLERIQEAMTAREESEGRLRRFVADASHELRTPVATVRGYAELYRLGGLADEDALSEAMRRTEQEATRMGELVDDMLLLARLDQGRPLEKKPVDLADVVTDVVADASVVHPHRRLTIETQPTSLVGDESRLRQVVANVVSNALVHTGDGDAVTVRLFQHEQSAVVEVIDTGPGMTEVAAAKATERFYRSDGSRTRAKGGSGLGLSIADSITAAHGGSLTVQSVEGSGTTVRVVLPLVGPTVADADG